MGVVQHCNTMHEPPLIDKDASYDAGQHFAKTFPESLDRVNLISSKLSSLSQDSKSLTNRQKSSSNSTYLDQKTAPKNALLEVLEESNMSHFKKIINKDKKEELEASPRSIRDYLAFKSTADVPDKKVPSNEKKEELRRQTSKFMCGIMDECTHLSNFSVPVDPELIISVAAEADAYVPRDGVADLRDIWKGSEVRYLNSGHVGAFLLHQNVFRKAIIDAFAKMKKKYYSNVNKPDSVV